jgi:hypothetical protein
MPQAFFSAEGAEYAEELQRQGLLKRLLPLQSSAYLCVLCGKVLAALALMALLNVRADAQTPDSSAIPDSLAFSVGELYAAFGLTMSEEDAYRMMKSLATFVVRDKGVEIQKTDGRKLSEDILVLLSLVSDSTAAKVGAVRRGGRASVTPEEEKRWAEQVEAMRRLAGGRARPRP